MKAKKRLRRLHLLPIRTFSSDCPGLPTMDLVRIVKYACKHPEKQRLRKVLKGLEATAREAYEASGGPALPQRAGALPFKAVASCGLVLVHGEKDGAWLVYVPPDDPNATFKDGRLERWHLPRGEGSTERLWEVPGFELPEAGLRHGVSGWHLKPSRDTVLLSDGNAMVYLDDFHVCDDGSVFVPGAEWEQACGALKSSSARA